MADETDQHRGDGPAILVAAVDGSSTSMRACAWAAGVARRNRSLLVCVHVTSHGGLASYALAAGVPQDYDPHGAGHELFEAIRPLIARHSVTAEFLECSGDPAAEIERIADDRRADAVVVGASMKAGHRLVGSVAVRLVRSAKWPVTVVP